MKKIIIAGGPHTGKTTLLNALKTEFPDAYFVSEASGTVIEHELGRAKVDPDYTPIVPWMDYEKFVPLVVEQSIKTESEIPDDVSVAFLDRSLIDNFVYFDINNFHKFDQEVKKQVAAARYDLVLICEPVGDFEPTEVRRENAEQATKIHRLTKEVYQKSGLPIIEIPPVSVIERVAIVKSSCGL